MPKKQIGSIILQVLILLSILLLIGIGGITLFIFLPSSSDKNTVIVPDVCGKKIVTAINILYKEKLRVNKIYTRHPLPKNYVISQYPLAGTKVRRGRIVELKVSKGMASVMVPNLQNINIAEAEHNLYRLSNHSLRIGRLSYTYSEIEKDYVIAQNPLPKTKIPEDSEVNLLISQGNRPISFYMPELTGMKLEEGIKIIKDVGLRITRIQEELCNNIERGTIINQKPLPMYSVTQGEGVTLIVANDTIDAPILKEDAQNNLNGESKEDIISN